MDDNSKLVDNDIIQYLLIHKSLVDEERNLDTYISILRETSQGGYINIDNPVDRSIALVFELVMQNHLDPWDIDLVRFSTLYLKRAQEEDIDLVAAGRIILMAWRILRLQSNNLVELIKEHQREVEETSRGGDSFQTEMWLSSDDPYSYVNLLLTIPDPPIGEPVRRETTRRVTLIELLEAFEEARREAELHQRIEEERRKNKEKMLIESHRRMIGSTHDDHLEEDVEDTWNKIKDSRKTLLTLQDLCNTRDKEEVIKTILSLLFLAYDNKIKLYQRRFPYGKIYVKPLGYT